MHRYLLILALLAITACQAPAPQAPRLPEVQKPDRVWNVAFLIMEGVYNTEFTAPLDILHHTVFHTDPGMKVFSVARNRNPVTTFEGVVIQPDYGYLTDSLPSIDVLVVPSAEHHLDTDLEDSTMISWVRETGQAASYVMSLCDGAFVLAQAGLLDGRVCTTFPSDIEAFRKRFPQLDVRENVLFVHDGKAITSAGGSKSFEPALYLAELLYGQKAAIGIGKGLVIDWDLAEIPCEIVMQ